MPTAVVTDETFHEDLKSCPGGFVVIKRMSFGQKLTRRQMAMKMRMSGDKRDMSMDIDMMNRLTTLWSFANLLIEHNLEDQNGVPLNFKREADVDKLDPRIGEEIDGLIDKHNNFEDDENSSEPGSLGNSNGGSEPAS